MPSQKYKNVSISMESHHHEALKSAANKQKLPGEQASSSKVVRELVDRYLVDLDEVVPIFLKVPIHLKEDSDELEKWLKIRFDAILNKLSS